MSFTVQHDPDINHQIQGDLDVITARLQAAVADTEAIILVGGFGRGEGGVRWVDGRYRPDNDYDIELITIEPVGPDRLHRLEHELAEELQVLWVHIENHTRASLGGLPFTQYVYDLKYSGRVLHGVLEVMDEIPDMDARCMPLAEGEKALFTRLWCFLGPDRTGPQENPEKEHFQIAQLSRALLALCDARLILEGAYDSSYGERRKRFLARFPEPAELRDLVDWAALFKLRPDIEAPRVGSLFLTVRRYYLQAMLDFARAARRQRYRDLADYAQSLKGWAPESPWKSAFKEKIRSLLGRPTPDTRYLQLLRLKLFAVAACPDKPGSREENQPYGRLARDEVEQLTGETAREWDWEKLRKETLRLVETG